MKSITRLMWQLKPIVSFIDKKFTLDAAIKKVTGDHYFLWRDKIDPGFVLLSSAAGHGSNLINPSDISHGAIYFGKGLRSFIIEALDQPTENPTLHKRLHNLLLNYNIQDDICYVIEAVAEGVIATNLVKFLTTKDVIKIVKPKFGEADSWKTASRQAVNYLGLSYDYGFTSMNNFKYCFEVVADAYEETNDIKLKRIEYALFGIRLYDIFLSDTFLDTEKWECVIDSKDYTEQQ